MVEEGVKCKRRMVSSNCVGGGGCQATVVMMEGEGKKEK